jgi:hypothetical protein
MSALPDSRESYAQTALSENQVKAALVFNFARYVEWPATAFANAMDPLFICHLGRDNLGGSILALNTRQVNGRAIRTRASTTLDETRGCHIVFLSDSEERRIAPLLRGLADKPILTVSDATGFAEAGGAIGIVQGETRLQFDVNRASLDLAQLKASSNLLKLARTLIERNERSDPSKKN